MKINSFSLQTTGISWTSDISFSRILWAIRGYIRWCKKHKKIFPIKVEVWSEE